MKALTVLTLVCAVLILSCATGPDYTKVETHVANLKDRSYPHMVYPAEYQKNLDAIAENGYELVGSVVDNRGGTVFFFEDSAGECAALIISGGRVNPITCEYAWYIYHQVCIVQEFCNENPYIDSKL